MKNIIDEKPQVKLSGRLKKTISFVDIVDIKNKSIIDVGCGYGWFVYNAFKGGAKNVAGIEISDEDLKTVKKYIHNPKFIAKVGSAIKIPFADKSFDTLVAWEVIEHIPKGTENLFFSEAKRVLKKNGTLYLSTPHASFFSTYFDPAYWLVGHRHYSAGQLTELGKEQNFIIEKVDVVGGFWTTVLVINMYISKWILRRGILFGHFFNKKENQEYLQSNKGYYNILVKFKKAE